MGREGRRLQEVAQVTVCCRSEHHDVFIGCQHQRCPHYCLGQGTGTTPGLVNAPTLHCFDMLSCPDLRLKTYSK